MTINNTVSRFFRPHIEAFKSSSGAYPSINIADGQFPPFMLQGCFADSLPGTGNAVDGILNGVLRLKLSDRTIIVTSDKLAHEILLIMTFHIFNYTLVHGLY